MFPKLQTWHSYLYRERDPENEGLIYIRHPWESGQDNSPIWDRVLNSIELTPEMVPKIAAKAHQLRERSRMTCVRSEKTSLPRLPA